MWFIWELIPSLWTVMMYVRLFYLIQLSFKNRQSQWWSFFLCFEYFHLPLLWKHWKKCYFFLKGLALNFVYTDAVLTFFLLLEPTVRTELMEQIPPIAIFLQESRPKFPTAFFEYLMPIVVRYLTDVNNQVGKTDNMSWIIGKFCVIWWI